MGQEASQVVCISGLHPSLVRKSVQLSPRDGDQRIFVLLGGIHLPVCHQEEEFRLVGQVQLYHERGVGCGDWICYCSHVLRLCCECFEPCFV